MNKPQALFHSKRRLSITATNSEIHCLQTLRDYHFLFISLIGSHKHKDSEGGLLEECHVVLHMIAQHGRRPLCIAAHYNRSPAQGSEVQKREDLRDCVLA